MEIILIAITISCLVGSALLVRATNRLFDKAEAELKAIREEQQRVVENYRPMAMPRIKMASEILSQSTRDELYLQSLNR